jgi:hypothetical protein
MSAKVGCYLGYIDTLREAERESRVSFSRKSGAQANTSTTHFTKRRHKHVYPARARERTPAKKAPHQAGLSFVGAGRSFALGQACFVDAQTIPIGGLGS